MKKKVILIALPLLTLAGGSATFALTRPEPVKQPIVHQAETAVESEIAETIEQPDSTAPKAVENNPVQEIASEPRLEEKLKLAEVLEKMGATPAEITCMTDFAIWKYHSNDSKILNDAGLNVIVDYRNWKHSSKDVCALVADLKN